MSVNGQMLSGYVSDLEVFLAAKGVNTDADIAKVDIDGFLGTIMRLNACFREAVKIYDAPHVLTELLAACRFLKRFRKDCSAALVQASKKLDVVPEEYEHFLKLRGLLHEEMETIEYRIVRLAELIEGQTTDRGVFMSHEEMLNFIDTLAPVPAEHGILGNPTPIDEPGGKKSIIDPSQIPPDELDDGLGYSNGPVNPYYNPARPLDQDQQFHNEVQQVPPATSEETEKILRETYNGKTLDPSSYVPPEGPLKTVPGNLNNSEGTRSAKVEGEPNPESGD